ncbi:MAG TPA: nucleotidyltransferase family protein [Anaerolineaceae bacterium]
MPVIHTSPTITAVVLAAGSSRRMGSPKLTLPWGNSTVIGSVINTLVSTGISQIIVVTGGYKNEVENALVGHPVTLVHNKDYLEGEMISSLKVGLHYVSEIAQAVLITLGDQPQIEPQVIHQILKVFSRENYPIIIPSYNHRRGHPWLLRNDYLAKVQKLGVSQSMRDFLSDQQQSIHYVDVNTNKVLMDLDTPEDYQRLKP